MRSAVWNTNGRHLRPHALRLMRGPQRQPTKPGPITKFLVRDDDYDTTPIILQSTNQKINLPRYNQTDRFKHLMKIDNPLLVQNTFMEQFNIQACRYPARLVDTPQKSPGKRQKTLQKTLVLPENSYILQPQAAKRPTIILDLDHTILNSTPSQQTVLQEDSVPGQTFQDGIHTVYRSYLMTFLQFVHEHFEVIAWSAGEYNYVKSRLMYHNLVQYFDFVLSREHCKLINNNYIKQLDMLGRDMQNTILLDDNFASCVLNVGNCVPVTRFVGQKDDELLQLIVLLRKLLQYETLVKGVEAQIGKFFYRSAM